MLQIEAYDHITRNVDLSKIALLEIRKRNFIYTIVMQVQLRHILKQIKNIRRDCFNLVMSKI
jgi:uncharacterized membrane-anchored protein YitT (DUF2179 family)